MRWRRPRKALPWVSIGFKYVNMADVNSLPPRSKVERDEANRASARVDDPSHVAMVELLFFAYRDFTGEADAVLAELSFGRAHHRVLHFVNRNPGLRVADLLGILKITKQSLARVLKQLVDEGYICQTAGAVDRRERRLHLTDRGRALAEKLLTLQARRLGAALEAIGPEAAEAAEAFLFGVISREERANVENIVKKSPSRGL
jgi:DNA-binding MarR family transcriptional regulator